MKRYQNKKMELVAVLFFIAFFSVNILFNPGNTITNFIFISAIALLLLYIRRLIEINDVIVKFLYILGWLYLAVLTTYYILVATKYI